MAYGLRFTDTAAEPPEWPVTAMPVTSSRLRNCPTERSGRVLYHYGKLRGASDEIVTYTYGKIYNAQAFAACSNMPRFGIIEY